MRFPGRLGTLALALVAAVAACSGPRDPQAPRASPDARPPMISGSMASAPRTPRRLRRLSNAELENVLADVLEARLELTKGFLPDPRDQGYDNDAVALGISESKVDEVSTAAERAAAFMTGDANLSHFAPCPSTDAPDACARAFTDRLVRRAWGRPASAEELDRLAGVFRVGIESEGYATGIDLVAQAVLQSPHFLYASELGAEPANGRVQLTGYEIASQLSFLLRGSRPDPLLLEAAANGALGSEEERERHARRLLVTPESRRQQVRFLRAWLGLVHPINKDLAVVPIFTPALRLAYEREVDTFLLHVLTGPGILDDLLLADYGFPAPVMREIYGDDLLEPPGDFTRVQLHARRRGVLTMPGFLANHALINQTNPVERGLVVRNRLLCQEVSPPPPDVVAQTPGGIPTQTTRQKYEAHAKEPRCRGCHRLMDPVGFGFEEFDLLGRHRTKEGDQPVDATGELVDTDVDGPFTGVAALSQRLAGSLQFRRCFVQQLWRATEGRAVTGADGPELESLATRFERAGRRIDELLVALVRRPTFIWRKVEP